MTTPSTPQRCINCPNPAIATPPIYHPDDANDRMCGECLAAYWACFEGGRDDDYT